MISYLQVAGILVLLLGVVHSVLGEVLIFKRLRSIDLTLPSGSPALSPRHLKTLWSTWHLVTLFGFGLGFTLLSFSSSPNNPVDLALKVISLTFFVSSIFWLIGTRGKHPAWLILLAVAILSWLA